GHSAAPLLLSADHPWTDTNIDANPAQTTAVAPGMDHSPDYDEQYVLKDSRAQISRDSVVAASTGYSASAILPSLRIALLLMQIQNLRKDRFRVERQRRETARLDTILRCVVPDERVRIRFIAARFDLDRRKARGLSESRGQLGLHGIELRVARVTTDHLDLIAEAGFDHEEQILEREGAAFLEVCLCFERLRAHRISPGVILSSRMLTRKHVHCLAPRRRRDRPIRPPRAIDVKSAELRIWRCLSYCFSWHAVSGKS